MTAKPRSRSRAPRKKSLEPAAPAPAGEAPPAVEALPPGAFTPPEVEFAARVPGPAPERTRPLQRRAIFIDVENESRAARIEQALDALQVDHAAATTDIIASGNWRVISNETARLLAKKGAQLVHSAPATGVRDWSDLRIAVAAGAWLASARPGDRLDIVSADRAFDAVGDVAATLGVEFHRHSQRAAATRAEAPARAPSRRSRGGRGRRKAPAPAAPVAAVEAPPAAPAAAPPDEILSVVRALLEASPQGVMLDAVAKRLKEKGFERPPNSPRLVTRLRSMKELRVSPRGHVTLAAPQS
jgi:hypothetical protein